MVGTPFANRDVFETHDVLGPFLNTLALRLDLAGDPTFSAAVGRAKAAATQAFAHGAAPFAKVVDSLGLVRSAAFTPIYQVWLWCTQSCRLLHIWPETFKICAGYGYLEHHVMAICR